MTFPFPVMLGGNEWGNSLWTDFTSIWNGDTYLGAYTVGSLMPDWSFVAGSGGGSVAQVQAAGGSTSGQVFRHSNAGGVGANDSLIWNTSPSTLNADILIGLQILQTIDPQGFVAGILAPFISSTSQNSGHFVRLGAGNRLEIFSQNGGVPTTSNALAGWSPLNWYWMRLNLAGSVIRVKFWLRGSAEPAGWLVTLSSGTAPATPGKVGLVLGAEATTGGPSQQYIDFYSVCTDGTPAWGPI